ncbi:MAG: 50S ribosomal protein L15 [Thermonemataceae bacterium]|nr:50S ribosomal protein L15 [Thermonemataceae bacterium]
MKLHELKPAAGSTKKPKRIGRGSGSGRGGTSTRGHKGAKSRSGYKSKRGFEGGQMPLQRRIPKFGFKNPFKVEYKPINLDTIAQMAEQFGVQDVDLAFLQQHGFASKKDIIKVLGRGELTSKVNVTAHAFSKTALEAIEKVGGTATTI